MSTDKARETIAEVIVDPNAENPDNHGLFFGLGRADAILAALPSILAGMVEPLEWDVPSTPPNKG